MYDGIVATLDEFSYDDFIQLSIVACGCIKPSTIELSFRHLYIPKETMIEEHFPNLQGVFNTLERESNWLESAIMFCSRLYQFASSSELQQIRSRQRWCFKEGLIDDDVFEVSPAQELEWDDEDVQFLRFIPSK